MISNFNSNQIINTMKKTITAVFALLSILAANAQLTGNFNATYTETGTGITRTIVCFVPTDYDSTKAYPLIYFWHGTGTPASTWRSLLKPVTDQIGAIVICPDANGMTANVQLEELINVSSDFIFRNYHIDSSKAIVSGHSAGGNYAFHIATKRTPWKGLIAINPAIGSGDMTPVMWTGVAQIKSSIILGSSDVNYSFVKQLADDIKTQGGAILYIEKPGVTHSDVAYFSSTNFSDDFYKSYLYVTGQSVGFAELPVMPLISIYPNPCKDNLIIDANGLRDLRFEIYGIDGKILETTSQISGSIIKVDLSIIPKGVYLLRLFTNDQVVTKKIIRD
jgi:pimeloyl-ACP methyl ester carboxylesterase